MGGSLRKDSEIQKGSVVRKSSLINESRGGTREERLEGTTPETSIIVCTLTKVVIWKIEKTRHRSLETPYGTPG